MRRLTLVVTLAGSAAAAELDLYPQARKLLLEAEKAAEGVSARTDHDNPMGPVAQRFARAGYLEDCLRIARRSGVKPWLFRRARVLYGDLDGALKDARAEADPHSRSSALEVIANVLWRMGDRVNAQLVLAESERSARAIADTRKRLQQQKLIEMEKAALPEDAPIPLTARPQPPANPRRTSAGAAPAFPITVDGFRRKVGDEAGRAAKDDEVYLTTLYALVGTRDRDGLAKHAAAASSPRQKLLGTVSLEHLLIQAGVPEGAEEAARSILDDGADATLAKAEALAAAGRAWAIMRNLDHAVRCFDDAGDRVNATKVPALALGKVKVAASIAALQAESRLTAASAKMFELAFALATRVEPRPNQPKYFFNREYREHGYKAIFLAAIHVSNDEVARRAGEAWAMSTNGRDSDSVAGAWLEAGRPDEALAYARSLKNAEHRVDALLRLADQMLEDAGAPAI